MGPPGPLGAHMPRLAWSVVASMRVFAVAVPFDTTATTLTLLPLFTDAIPLSPPFTDVPELTVYVMAVLSALVTTRLHVLPDTSVTEVTVPVWNSIVSYPFGPLTVASPCRTAPNPPNPRPSAMPGPPKPRPAM